MIEIDSHGVLTANGNLEVFSRLGQKAGQTSDDMARKFSGAGKATDDMAKKFGAFQLVVNKLPGPLKSIAGGLMGMVSPATAVVGVFLELGEAVVNFAKESVQAFADFEMIKANLEVVMGSAKQAATSFDEIRKMAGRTPFNVEQLANAAVQLKQTGTAASELIPVLTMLGNTAGGSSDKFNRVVANFAQIQSMGKTTAIDLRQFAMMGIPIYDMLKQMGVEGNATADQISEAFRRMTTEGGAFYNAMEKGAATLQGKITNLEGSWKSLQATIVDKSGLDDTIKYIVDAFQFVFSNIDNYINKRSDLNDAMLAWDTGTFTPEQALLVLNEKIKETAEQYKYIYDMMNDPYGGIAGDRNYDIAAFELTEQLATLRKQFDYYANIVKKEKDRTTELERQNRLIETQKEAYNSIMVKINDIYESTPQGQIEALEEELTKYKNFLAQGPLREVLNLFSYPAYGPQNQSVETHTRTIGISEEDRRKTAMAMREIADKITSLKKQLNEAKVELNDWQQLLQSTLDISDQAALSGIAAIDEYTTGFYDRLAGALSYAQMAGEDAAEVYGEFADEIDRAMRTLMYSGNFKIDDTSIKGLSELLSKIESLAKVQKKIDIREILGVNEVGQGEAFDKYLFDLRTSLNKLNSAYNPSMLNYLHPDDEFLPEEDNGIYSVGYTASVKRIQEYMSATGVSFEQLYSDIEQQMRAVIDELYTVGISIPEDMLELYKNLKSVVDENNNNIARNKAITDLMDEISLKEKSLWLSQEQARVQELVAEGYDRSTAELQAHSEQINRELDTTKEVIESLKEASISLAATSLVDFANDLGKAFQDGTASSDEFTGAIRNMLKSITDAMPQLLLNVGLQLISEGAWEAGLVFIGASGLMSFIGGLIPEAGDNRQNDELEKLNRIQQQITDLIASQREQEEYYTAKKRQLNAQSAINVNDAIITPQGVVNTHPEDYIIATKHPETLMSGRAAPVYINIINNTPATVTTQESMDENGSDQITVLIDQVVQSGLANGRYDRAMGNMNRRIAGRRLTS